MLWISSAPGWPERPFLYGEPVTATISGLVTLLTHTGLSAIVEHSFEKIGGLAMKALSKFPNMTRAIPMFAKKLLLPALTSVTVAI
ncbi:hypothetical protein [Asticcacaulis sp. W401b]|uniref:hypothetical protein n=1 Tax=Asticcacaulis sp. W401b TaxID=3388666 RepID=UPI0039708C31